MDQALVMVVVGAVAALRRGFLGDRDRLQPSPAVWMRSASARPAAVSSAVIVTVDRMLTGHRSWRFHGGAFGRRCRRRYRVGAHGRLRDRGGRRRAVLPGCARCACSPVCSVAWWRRSRITCAHLRAGRRQVARCR